MVRFFFERNGITGARRSTASLKVLTLFLGFLILFSTDALVVQVAKASGSGSPSVQQQLPYYSETYASNRAALAGYLEGLYNTTYHLIQGTVLCGIQTNAFSIIDENFFDGPALEEYDASMSASVNSSVYHYLGLANYQNDDRREVLFGHSISVPPNVSVPTAVVGTLPTCPNGGKNTTAGFFIVTEKPSTPVKSYTNAMNYLTVAGLGDYLAGNVSGAQTLFNLALSWWTYNSTYHGFLSPAQMPCPAKNPNCASGNNFNTRDLAYFLFFARATRFYVSPTILNEIETTLWSQQIISKYSGGIATSYSYNGSALPKGGHTSGEINGLALLAYDPRIQTTWWPGPIQTLPTTTAVSCSPSSVPVNSSTTCVVSVRNENTSIASLPTGQVGFMSSGPGSFTPTNICNLAQVNSTTEGCSLNFIPGPAGVGAQWISASYGGDVDHSSSDAESPITAAVRTTLLMLSCTPATGPVNAPFGCTITVSDSGPGGPIIPGGNVSVSTPWASPPVSHCALAYGVCSIKATPDRGAEGTQDLHATYSGDVDHSGSAGDGSFSVTQRSSSVSLTCSPSQVRHGSQVKCTITVKDSTSSGASITPTGSVSFSANRKIAFNPSVCVLSPSGPGQASCSMKFTPHSKATGALTVTASFGGDQDHAASAGQASVKVR